MEKNSPVEKQVARQKEIDNNKLASLQDTWTLPRMEVKQLFSQPVPQ